MPVEVKRLPDEPIIVLTYSGAVDAGTVESAFQQSIELIDGIGGTAYRISDVRALQVDERRIGELFKLIIDLRRDKSGSSADPRIHGVFVGGHQLARIYADFMRQHQFGGTLIPFYHTLDEALAYIHFQIEQAKESQ